LRPGDILFNEGGDRDKLGRGWVWNGELPECIHQNHVFRARRFDPAINPKLVSWYANTFGQQFFFDEGKHTTNLASISMTKLKALPVPIPPPDEQTRIVAAIEKQFTRLEAGVAALRRVQANLKRYRAAVLKAACEGRLVPTEAELARTGKRKSTFETGEALLARILTDRRKNWQGRGKYKEPLAPNANDLPQLSPGWTWSTAEQLTLLVTSGSRGWGEFYSDEGPLFIRAQDIKTDSLKLAGIARVALPEKAEGMRSSVENCDLLVTITGANVTKSAIVRGLSEVAFVSQHVALLKLVCRETSPFLFLWIVSPAHGRKSLERWAYGAGKPGLSLEQVRGLPIPLPPLAEQTRIVAEVERRLSVVEELEAVVSANLQRATRLRQSILQKAFTGELV
jgi:type I restriction enzyme S subunit